MRSRWSPPPRACWTWATTAGRPGALYVLGMLDLSVNPLDFISWDNLDGVLQLADKYDMQAERDLGATFLILNAQSLSLDPPLSSPKNLLKAASLVERYFVGLFTDAGCQLAAVVDKALESSLEEIEVAPYYSKDSRRIVRGIICKLKPLIEDASYATTVSGAVQVGR
ncbi:hypothetical protein GPECTOR_4g697 [Gonium pectorale]|uniref:Uncharacterized protein n=1 Tax=Gonium pectorale TaxID=33097 RepID=A0A150GY50_GONPE|nr:hypothetical protein GPECTOR_4g697 [Gonium pectorale]|eukprot:KXZ54632.1 hypothetical protein GPECTOR_4g697 [Gonium pectorale]